MDKSREFTDGGEQTQQPQKQIKQTSADSAAQGLSIRLEPGLFRGGGVSKEQNNLGIRSTLKRRLHRHARILHRPSTGEKR